MKKKKASNLLNELSPDEVMDIYTFLKKFHHYCSSDKELLPTVKRDFMKKSFLLAYKIEAYINDMEV